VGGAAAASRDQPPARRYALGRRLDGSAPARAVGDPASVEESPLNVAVLADDPLGAPVQVQASGALALRVAYDRIISRRYEGRCPNLPQRPRSRRSAREESLIFRVSSRRRFRRGTPLWQIWTRPSSGPSQEPHAHHSASIPPTPPRRSPPMGRRAPKTHSTAPNNLPVRVRVITGRR